MQTSGHEILSNGSIAWIWRCSQNHANSNVDEFCISCQEKLMCDAAGGHHDTIDPRGFCDRCNKRMNL